MSRFDLWKTTADARSRLSPRETPAKLNALWTAIAGIATGALAAFLLDPQRGKSRRARIMDQGAAIFRRGARGVERQGRRIGSDVEGKAQAIQRGGDGGTARANDATLSEKVQSELFRDPSIPKGAINVNVERGTVVLRGEVADAKLRRKLETTVKRIPGVAGVSNLLHLPGEAAKAAR